MRGALLFFAGALIFTALAALLGQTASVGAVGAPTDNYTMPNIPVGDRPGDEIIPSVNYVLQGPTAQPKSAPPNFIPNFTSALAQGKSKITANENWYLDVDINTPGWLYIYEYFQVGNDFQGKWIAYKWQLLQSGLWRLGPFTPRDNEAEGQHIYRIWFYSDGQWAAEDPIIPQKSLVYWTYSKGQPSEQVLPQPSVAPIGETAFLDQVYRFITKPAVLLLASSVLIIMVVLGLYLSGACSRRRRSQDTISLSEKTEPEGPSAVVLSAARAKIALPNGMEIHFARNSRVIGRGDLARVLDLDELGLISRQHFEVKYEKEQFYVEDVGSANGTRLNGADISGKGPVILNDDDVIEPAGAIRLKFYIL